MAKSSIKVIINKRANLSEKEYEWYQGLEKRYPNLRHFLAECVEFDDEGKIESFSPIENMPLEILYFALVVSVNQRLRLVDDALEGLRKNK